MWRACYLFILSKWWKKILIAYLYVRIKPFILNHEKSIQTLCKYVTCHMWVNYIVCNHIMRRHRRFVFGLKDEIDIGDGTLEGVKYEQVHSQQKPRTDILNVLNLSSFVGSSMFILHLSATCCNPYLLDHPTPPYISRPVDFFFTFIFHVSVL